VEASYEARRFIVTVGYSTVDGKNSDTGAKLGVLTPDQYIFGAAYKVLEIDSLIGWRSLIAHSFDKVNDPADARDGYSVHDVFFSWQPRDRALAGLRLDLGIDNLFDEAYARVFTGALEPGRNYKAVLSWTQTW
jgi:hemoglobin/transferrin/lactoferrin receptor protein